MAQVGRISGPLLFANLERNGIDLSFGNTLQTTPLLYLDVDQRTIGIDTDSPVTDIEISQTAKTIDLISNSLSSTKNTFFSSTIENSVGDINLDAKEAVRFGGLSNGTIFIKDNSIFTEQSNSAIDLQANGTGAVEFQSSANVFGNLFTEKNITLDGTINFGNENTDTVDFNSDVNSDLIPDNTNTFQLGTPTKRWNNTFTKLVNGESVSTTELSAGQIDFNLRQGNIFYVAKNGDDSAYGDHPLAPFKTIKKALDAADASIEGPVSVHIFPGEYEEQLPLTVPNRVSVIGNDLRSVIIKPDQDSQTSDVFLLDGDTTIENLTVRDFYFDNNQGYAFRFRPGGIIESRSPYINNVTVITRGSQINAEDPRGFDSGDAGRGAYIDGAELDSLSEEASMLFSSCTFITPGVDAVTMTNGVRVEWLASFTYFANRGLYAFNNSTGRVTADGSTVKFGAEVRSIASANIYGNQGTVADGDDCLMYLIKHNFSYVGSGKNVANDKTLAVQKNETVEENSGRIVFTSIDHLGTYRVGDGFFTSFETGETSISNKTISGDQLTNLRLQNNGDETFFDFDNYFTGNIEVNDNLIESFIGDINISAPDTIELKDNTSIGNNLTMSGDLSFGGNLNLFGNEPGDTVDFNTPFDQDFTPNQNSQYDLGKNNKRWNAVWLRKIGLGSIEIFDNNIQSVESNADLELRANGTGSVNYTSDVSFLQSLTVNNSTDLQSVNLVNLDIDADISFTGTYATENLFLNGNISVNAEADFENIVIENNFISTLSTNTDLELKANSSGRIIIPANNAEIQENLSVRDLSVGDVTLTGTVRLDEIDIPTGNIEINDNYIQTEVSNSDLELRAQGSGVVNVDLHNTRFNQKLNVIGISQIQSVSFTDATQEGNYTQIGNRNITGNLSIGSRLLVENDSRFENIEITQNKLQTTQTNSDLTLRAAGTGRVLVNANAAISNNLSVSSIDSGKISVETQVQSSKFFNNNILIDDNFITTTTSNSDLEVKAIGTGSVVVEEIFVTDNILETASTDIILASNIGVRIDSVGALQIPKGITDQIILEAIEILDGGNSDNASLIEPTVDGGFSDTIYTAQDEVYNGDESIVEPTGGTGDIRFNTEIGLFEGFQNATVSFGGLYSDDRETSLLADPIHNFLEFRSDTNIIGTVGNQGIDVVQLQTDDIQINNNFVTTAVANSNLDLTPNGTGEVKIGDLFFTGQIIKNLAVDDKLGFSITGLGYQKINGTVGVVVPRGTSVERPPTPETGETRWNTTTQILEVWDGSFFVDAAGTSQFISQEEFDDLITEYTIMFG